MKYLAWVFFFFCCACIICIVWLRAEMIVNSSFPTKPKVGECFKIILGEENEFEPEYFAVYKVDKLGEKVLRWQYFSSREKRFTYFSTKKYIYLHYYKKVRCPE